MSVRGVQHVSNGTRLESCLLRVSSSIILCCAQFLHKLTIISPEYQWLKESLGSLNIKTCYTYSPFLNTSVRLNAMFT